MNSNEKPKSPLLTLGGVAGAIIGFYCGLMLLVPIGIAFLAGAILKNINSPNLTPFKVAAAVVIGHTAWMSMGFLVKGVEAWTILPDIVLMVIGLIWLFVKPGRGVVWYFTLLEGVVAVVNVINLLQQPFGSTEHKALVAHLCLRIFAIVTLWIGLRAKTPTPPPIPAMSAPVAEQS